MNLAIFHHHLCPGGVTQVIRSHLEALDGLPGGEGYRVAVFHGGRRDGICEDWADSLGKIEIQWLAEPLMEYDSERTDFSRDSEVVSLFAGRLAEIGFTTDETILHFHNHSLGKNRTTCSLVSGLAAKGFRTLLQIHDFAEDSRTENYRYQVKTLEEQGQRLGDLFPVAEQVHYATINQRDREILAKTSISSESIHLLPNSISHGTSSVPGDSKLKFAERHRIDPESRLLLYPVRGIRRKNLGEAMLLGQLSQKPTHLALTLPPRSLAEKPNYQSWVDLANRLRLPVLFGIGEQTELSFEENLAAADQLVTTSVAEGFGLVFIESVACGKPLLGRDLPGITADFKKRGMELDRLYREVRVPFSLLNSTDYRDQMIHWLEMTCRNYGVDCKGAEFEQMFERIVDRGWVDFGKLPSAHQRFVLRRVFTDPRIKEQIRSLNPLLMSWLDEKPVGSESGIAANQRIVKEHYSIHRIGQQLEEIYRSLLDSPITMLSENRQVGKVLDYFLQVDGFCPIRLESAELQHSPNPGEEFRTVFTGRFSKLEPIATGISPRLKQIEGVRAVLFDVYGTMLISSSGDVGTDTSRWNQNRQQDERLEELLAQCGMNLETAINGLRCEIEVVHQEMRAAGFPFPEVDICDVWKTLIRKHLSGAGKETPEMPARKIRELAVRFELAMNSVYPMPGLIGLLDWLRKKEKLMGVISNAQFYTPLIFESQLGKTMSEAGFEEELVHFSYRTGRAKPGDFLYKSALKSIEEFGLASAEVLYIGNDMEKDILPAKRVGFRTGLFAGDKRSLRLGKESGRVNGDSVDLVLTELSQVTSVI